MQAFIATYSQPTAAARQTKRDAVHQAIIKFTGSAPPEDDAYAEYDDQKDEKTGDKKSAPTRGALRNTYVDKDSGKHRQKIVENVFDQRVRSGLFLARNFQQ
jgi:hypothetical protein